MTSTPSVNRFRTSQEALNRKRRETTPLTDKEWSQVKAFIQTLRAKEKK